MPLKLPRTVPKKRPSVSDAKSVSDASGLPGIAGPSDLQSRPYNFYVVPLADAAAGKLPQKSKESSGSRRVNFTHGSSGGRVWEEADSVDEVFQNGTAGKTPGTELFSNRENLQKALKRLAEIEKQDPVRQSDREYEIRQLEVPELDLSAWWLHEDEYRPESRDLFIPLKDVPPLVDGAVYQKGNFVRLIGQKVASLRETPRPAEDISPSVPNEPPLKVEDIQGNILAGFNKDYQVLLFLQIVEPEPFKAWLKKLTPFVASTSDVLTFNRLFKKIRDRQKDPRTRALRSTWLHVAFSFGGLKKLAPNEEVGQFQDTAFRKGLPARSQELGDPQEGEGSPGTWVVGGPGNEPDVVLIVASDLECDLLAEVNRIERSLFDAGRGNGRGTAARIVYKEQGAVLPPPLRGHEHFGFLDGISQPGLRGRISEDLRDVLTFRENPGSRDHGKPGQDLIWPGEFVFGYPGQDAKDADRKGPNSLQPNGHSVAPEWAENGSYLVIRRLRQNVPAFREFVASEAAKLGLCPNKFAAKIIGRHPSGAPVVLTEQEDPKLGADENRNNDFEFHSEPGEDVPGADDFGLRCPRAGHIRKVYPRNDPDRFVSGNGEADAQKHRVIRRGIPFGPPYLGTSESGGDDKVERGLLFLAYQTSIENQFEHIQKQFANNVEPDPETGDMRAGHDLVIGQKNGGPRSFVVPKKAEEGEGVERHVVEAPKQWVLPTGGGYFFSPSISALGGLATKVEEKTVLLEGSGEERKLKAVQPKRLAGRAG